LENNEENKNLRRNKVRIYDYPDGTLSIKHDSVALPYEVCDKVRQVKQAGIVSNKRLGSVLQFVREQQQRWVERSKKAPKRRGQKRISKEKQRQNNPAAQ